MDSPFPLRVPFQTADVPESAESKTAITQMIEDGMEFVRGLGFESIQFEVFTRVGLTNLEAAVEGLKYLGYTVDRCPFQMAYRVDLKRDTTSAPFIHNVTKPLPRTKQSIPIPPPVRVLGHFSVPTIPVTSNESRVEVSEDSSSVSSSKPTQILSRFVVKCEPNGLNSLCLGFGPHTVMVEISKFYDYEAREYSFEINVPLYAVDEPVTAHITYGTKTRPRWFYDLGTSSDLDAGVVLSTKRKTFWIEKTQLGIESRAFTRE